MTSNKLARRFIKDLVSRERYVILFIFLLFFATSGSVKLIVTLAAVLSFVVWTVLWTLEQIFQEDSPQ